MLQMENDWRSAANLELLLGDHPPVRHEKPMLRANDAAARARVPRIDARNTVHYRSASYGGAQDLTSARCRKMLTAYYREMLSKVSLWSAIEAAMVKGEAPASNVKVEEADADDDAPATALPDAGRPQWAHLPRARHHHPNTGPRRRRR
ncbi:hypothetical protein STCU_10421 [Strigomonas culicis]|uniref:Uncharacterized protein n=1 Tax=Strigomonas culicis TaxID=28005 RepID=S9TI60_9TRYP|nr:hypothetical protein STCU_10421 [Strigomonas culicis]|eukprot:EPY17762.1 hypothetical protein STCU_10421 [Strigomonas culicis]